MTAALLTVGCVFFDIFATAEVQEWGLVKDVEEGAEMKLNPEHEQKETLETTE